MDTPDNSQPKQDNLVPIKVRGESGFLVKSDPTDRLARAIEEQNQIARMTQQRESWRYGWKLDGDPAKNLECWGELESSDELRNRVRVGLLTVYADACSSKLNNSDYTERLQVLQTGAFDVIAGELLSLGLLTNQMLTNRLHEIVADITVSAGMVSPSAEFRADLSKCPGKGFIIGGQYWLRSYEILQIKAAVHPRVCYWQAQLLGVVRKTAGDLSPTTKAVRARGTPHENPESLLKGKSQITKQTAGVILGLSERGIRYLIEEGKLRLIGGGHRTMVTVASLRTQIKSPTKSA